MSTATTPAEKVCVSVDEIMKPYEALQNLLYMADHGDADDTVYPRDVSTVLEVLNERTRTLLGRKGCVWYKGQKPISAEQAVCHK